ncbi:hypothetical protein ACVBEH_25540, partial [Roseateles sp. GG27B]
MKTSAFAPLGSALVLLSMAVALPCCAAAAGVPPVPQPPASAPAASCPAAADMAKLSVDKPVVVVPTVSAAQHAQVASSAPPVPPPVRPVV